MKRFLRSKSEKAGQYETPHDPVHFLAGHSEFVSRIDQWYANVKQSSYPSQEYEDNKQIPHNKRTYLYQTFSSIVKT